MHFSDGTAIPFSLCRIFNQNERVIVLDNKQNELVLENVLLNKTRFILLLTGVMGSVNFNKNLSNQFRDILDQVTLTNKTNETNLDDLSSLMNNFDSQ